MDLIRDFTDFHLFEVTPERGTLVTGFAAARGERTRFNLITHLTQIKMETSLPIF